MCYRHSPGTSNNSKIRTPLTRLQPLVFKTPQKPLPHVPAGLTSLLPCAPLSLLKYTYRMGGSGLDSRVVLSSLASLGLSLSRYIFSSLAYKSIIHDLVDILFRSVHSKQIFLVWVFKATFYSIEFTFDPGFAYYTYLDGQIYFLATLHDQSYVLCLALRVIIHDLIQGFFFY